MELGKVVTLDFIVSDPTTGEPINADSTPTVSVYESEDAGSMYAPTAALRGPAVGHYLVTLDVSEANGFEKGKSYNVMVAAEVGGVLSKMILVSFNVEETMEKKTSVAAMLNVNPIPDFFEPDMGAYDVPLQPPSLNSLFGHESGYEFQDLFVQYYDQSNKKWTDYGEVAPEIKAAVLIAQEALDIYAEDTEQLSFDTLVEREVQWRALMAEKLMAHTE